MVCIGVCSSAGFFATVVIYVPVLDFAPVLDNTPQPSATCYLCCFVGTKRKRATSHTGSRFLFFFPFRVDRRKSRTQHADRRTHVWCSVGSIVETWYCILSLSSSAVFLPCFLGCFKIIINHHSSSFQGNRLSSSREHCSLRYTAKKNERKMIANTGNAPRLQGGFITLDNVI